ncbi:MAG: hypothetical protein K2X99_04265 [Gemmatimonadaceae bacterium]|nr:hypothetical protein [Gemmatimonadaceae bacterium]
MPRVVACLYVLAVAASAQARPSVEIALPPAAQARTLGPSVRARAVLRDARTQELLEAGFPARLHFRVELWSEGGWVNDLEGSAEWDVVLRYLPFEKLWEVVQVVNGRPLSLGRFARFDDAERASERPVRAEVRPVRARRAMYYQAVLTVESLSVSDLDELDRWLRGELLPAVRLQRNPGTALSRGVRQLTARLLGGDRREYAVRSERFGA